MEKFKLELHETENDSLMEILGISKDRVDEFLPKVDRAYLDADYLTDGFQVLLDECKNFNEVVYFIHKFAVTTTLMKSVLKSRSLDEFISKELERVINFQK